MVRFNDRPQRIPPDYYDFSDDYSSAPPHIYNPQDRYPRNSTYQNQPDSYQDPNQNTPKIEYPNANGIQLMDTFDNLN